MFLIGRLRRGFTRVSGARSDAAECSSRRFLGVAFLLASAYDRLGCRLYADRRRVYSRARERAYRRVCSRRRCSPLFHLFACRLNRRGEQTHSRPRRAAAAFDAAALDFVLSGSELAAVAPTVSTSARAPLIVAQVGRLSASTLRSARNSPAAYPRRLFARRATNDLDRANRRLLSLCADRRQQVTSGARRAHRWAAIWNVGANRNCRWQRRRWRRLQGAIDERGRGVDISQLDRLRLHRMFDATNFVYKRKI